MSECTCEACKYARKFAESLGELLQDQPMTAFSDAQGRTVPTDCLVAGTMVSWLAAITVQMAASRIAVVARMNEVIATFRTSCEQEAALITFPGEAN